MKQQLANGASYIKIMNESGATVGGSFPKLPPDIMKSIVNTAHAHDTMVVAHAMSFDDTIEALECGLDGTTHCILDEAKSMEKLLSLYRRNKAHCNPTLGILGSLTTEGAALQARFSADPLAQRMLMSSSSIEHLCQCIGMAQGRNNAVKNTYACTRALYEAGVPIIAGSDATGPARGTAHGLSLHMEIHLLVHEVGMAPTDVLKSATSLTAERFGFNDIGLLEVGRSADLLLVEGDILEFLKDRKNLCLPVKGVWREGVIAKEWAGTLA